MSQNRERNDLCPKKIAQFLPNQKNVKKKCYSQNQSKQNGAFLPMTHSFHFGYWIRHKQNYWPSVILWFGTIFRPINTNNCEKWIDNTFFWLNFFSIVSIIMDGDMDMKENLDQILLMYEVGIECEINKTMATFEAMTPIMNPKFASCFFDILKNR